MFRTLIPWMDIEWQARELWTWEPLMVPGLLQTEGYARAIIAGNLAVQGDQVEEAIQGRMARQAIFRRADPPALCAVLDEGLRSAPAQSAQRSRPQSGGAQCSRRRLGQPGPHERRRLLRGPRHSPLEELQPPRRQGTGAICSSTSSTTTAARPCSPPAPA